MLSSDIFRPHSPKQQSALLSNKKINLIATGVQWGKTTVGAVWLKRHIHNTSGEGSNYIIYAPTYKILQQSTLPAFLKAMAGTGVYRKSDSVFEINGARTVSVGK